MTTEDRSSNVDFEDCEQCADHVGSGICSNCEADGGHCEECSSTGKCAYCEGTGRAPIPEDPEVRAAAEAAGPLIVPEGFDADSS